MTTRKFSATNLPHPRYALEVGRFGIGAGEQLRHQHKRQKLISDNTSQRDRAKVNVADDNGGDDGEVQDDDDDKSSNVNLPPTCLPRFSQLAQVIEVKKPGLTLPNRVSSNIEDFLGSHCVIENARPELFIRRDFISKFVDKGTIFVAQLSDHQGATAATTNRAPESSTDAQTEAATAPTTCGYSLSTTKNNVMIITMNSKQYHRFGMLATKVVSPLEPPSRRVVGGSTRVHEKLYSIRIDLHDGRIMRNNKYQDRLVKTLRRLSSINKIYFRFIPDKSKLDLSIAAAQELSVEYFNYVIDEYNLDGCKPVPLTRCLIGQQRVLRNWMNYSQLHPSLDLSKLISSNGGNRVLFESQLDRGRDDEKFARVMSGIIDIVDWLGYQLLSLDCDRLAKIHDWNANTAPASKRVDVSCTQLIGMTDFEHVQNNLDKLFELAADDDDDETDKRRDSDAGGVDDNADGDDDSDVVCRALILYDSRDDRQLLMFENNGEVDARAHEASGAAAAVVVIDDEAAGRRARSRKEPRHDQHGWPPKFSGEGDDCLCSNNRCVIYLQDCSNGPKAAREITVIGLSNLGI